MSRRRYGVTSEGKKFKSLTREPGWEFEALSKAVLRGSDAISSPRNGACATNGGSEEKEAQVDEPSQGNNQEDQDSASAPAIASDTTLGAD